MTDLLHILGREGWLAHHVADAVTELTRQGLALGEMEPRQVTGIDGALREIRVFPDAWARRLERAVATGAFARMDIADIVERILTTSAPSEGTPA